MGESFSEFKDSFSYGSRSDLSFKFLKGLTDERASDFLAEILHQIGELYDGGASDALIDLAYEAQIEAYTPKKGSRRRYVYDDRPFQPLAQDLANTSVGLLTSSGHYSADDPPGDGRADSDQGAVIDRIDEFLRQAPELARIPVSDGQLVVKHPGYDVRSAERDPEVTFPAGALTRAAGAGRIGGLADVGYSFVGACSQGRLRKELDAWVGMWKEASVEALFLVPV